MRKSWFFAGELALRLARNDVSNREAAYLVLASLIFGSILYYSGVTWGNPVWNFLSLYEFVLVVAISFYGFSRCFFVAGGDPNDAFVRDFTCLSFPVFFWTNLLVWAVHWSGIWLFRQGAIAAFNYRDLMFAKNLAAVGGTFNWLWTFLSVVGLQVIYFAWMSKVLKACAEARVHG